jgi:bacteriophage exclusion system BrxC/D-like protein
VFSPGSRVRSSALGTGVVVRVTSAGVVVALDDFNGLEAEISAHDLTVDMSAPSSAIIPSASQPAGPSNSAAAAVLAAVEGLNDDRSGPQGLAYRTAVEALRFGLVPNAWLEEMTLGYGTLRDWVREQLPHENSGKPTVSEVSGPFGTGKSHTMAVVRHLAAGEGYLTAHVEVDGQSVTLSDPEPLLQKLWATLRGTSFDSASPMIDLYTAAIARKPASPSLGADASNRIPGNYRSVGLFRTSGQFDGLGSEVDALLCSGDEVNARELNAQIGKEARLGVSQVKFQRVIPTAVMSRPAGLVEALFGHALVAQAAGFKGLVVTIDEFEVEHKLTRSRIDRLATFVVLLSRYLTGAAAYTQGPLSIFVASVGQEHHVGDGLIEELIRMSGGARFELKKTTVDDREELASRIFALYGNAYELAEPFGLDDVRKAELEVGVGADSGLIRAFVKRYVSLLDSRFGPPYS